VNVMGQPPAPSGHDSLNDMVYARTGSQRFWVTSHRHGMLFGCVALTFARPKDAWFREGSTSQNPDHENFSVAPCQ
jgi:hypothetical protein